MGPILTPLASLSIHRTLPLPPVHDAPEVVHFVVVRDGDCEAGVFGAGEVLVCRGEARDGDWVVLVPRGPGRPKVGRVMGTRLYGDAGEPCHHARWSVAGRLVATWGQRAGDWVCQLVEEPGTEEFEASEPVEDSPSVQAASQQLSLFEVAA